MKEFIEKLIGRLEEEAIETLGISKSQFAMDEGEYSSYCSLSLCDVKEHVNELAEEHNGGWIPCSERLPESGVHVLCYGKNSLGSFKYEVSVYAEEIECWMCSKIADVIAWQPLPAPYENTV